MKFKNLVLGILVMGVFLALGACQSQQPQTVVQTVEVIKTVEVEKTVEVIKTVEVEKIVEATPAAASQGVDLKGQKIAAIFPGTVNDAGWTAQAYLAVLKLRDKHGMEIAYTENVKAEDSAQLARDYADAGYQYVFAHSFDYDAPLREVAKEYPDVKFIVNNGTTEVQDGVYTMTFAPGEGGYFVGRMACDMSKSGKVTFIGGVAFPILDYEVEMATQGCKDLKPEAEVIYSVVGSWTDPAKAKELAVAAMDQGADVFITIANAGDAGVLEAVKEAYEGGKKDVRLVSWSSDKHSLGIDFITAGLAQDASVALEWMMTEVLPTQKGGHFTPGVREGALYFFPFYGLVDPKVEQNHLDTLKKYIEDPSTLPNLKIRQDM